MRIAIYCPCLQPDKMTWTGEEWFCFETTRRMAASNPGQEFLVISDQEMGGSPFEEKNIHLLALNASKKHFLSVYQRINWKLPALLKDQKADILLSMNGVIPLRKNILSCLVIQDMSFMGEKARLADAYSMYKKRYFHKSLLKSGCIATVSHFCKQELISRFHIPAEKMEVVHRGINDLFKPLGWKEREQVKEEYTNGREFFIYSGAIHPDNHIIDLLKAFSIVKKKLFSNMALVLTGPLAKPYKKFPELLNTYHYRKDVKWLTKLPLSEKARLTGAAYAAVYPASSECFGTSLLEALACQTPVVAARIPAFEETAGKAAWYFDPLQTEDMGERMCEIYKDEELRAKIIAEAGNQSAKFSWNHTTDQLWNSLFSLGLEP